MNRYAYGKNSPPNYVDPSGHTSVGIDRILSPVYEKMLGGLKKSAMKIASEILANTSPGGSDSLSGMFINGLAGGMVIAVALSEDELCMYREEIKLSMASYLLGMVSEYAYYCGSVAIGQDRMALLEILQMLSGTDAEFDYAMENLDAVSYYQGKEALDLAYVSLGETLSSPLALLAQLIGAVGSGGGGSISCGYSGVGNAATAGVELESGLTLSNGLVIAVSVAGVAGAAGSNMEEAGNARAEENRAKAERAADSKKNKIPDNDSTTGHIFRDAEGHIPDTPENRTLLEDVANDSANFRGTDKYGNEWYTKTQSDGSQVWVESRNGNIFEGGINDTPKLWNPETGLKKP